MPAPDPVSPLHIYEGINFTRNIAKNVVKIQQILTELGKLSDYLDEFRAKLTEVVSKDSGVSIKSLDDLRNCKDPDILQHLETNLIEEIIHKV